VRQTNNLLEEYELGEAARLIYEFIWNDFCDWYVELSKYFLYRKDQPAAEEDRNRTRAVLAYVLDGVMRLLHPFMPFISEEIWQQLPNRREEALIVASWPEPLEKHLFPQEAAEMQLVQEVARAIRNLRSQIQLPPGKKAAVIVRAGGETARCLQEESHQLARLAFAEPLTVEPDALKPKQSLTAIIGDGLELFLPLEGIIDVEAEIGRLEKEFLQVQAEKKKTDGKLKSDGFIKKAPPEVIAKEEARREEQAARLTKLEQRLRELK